MTETLLPAGPPATTSSTPATAPVTAVVVTRGRTPYLSTTLQALAAQTRKPMRVVLVDVGAEHDGRLAATFEQAFAAEGSPALVMIAAPGTRTFGGAVRRALADGVDGDGLPATWLWLLHDDSAPAPTALAELTRAVTRARSVGVAGVKQLHWSQKNRLLEAGLRTSRSGRRMTGVEPGELDQGQHDGRDDVLGVGIAGALVRRDVWDTLEGPDPALGPFGDGLDLSRRARLAGHRVIVVPEAVVRHAQASFFGLRDDAGARANARRSHGARRQAVVHQRLTTAPLPLVPVVAVLAVVIAVVRSLVQVAAKQPALAVDELRAPLAAFARTPAIIRARRTARRTHTLSRRTLRPLQATWRDVWRQAQDRRLARIEARKIATAPSELELRELAGLTTRRRVTLGATMALLALVAAIALGPLIGATLGGARLAGQALAPAASDLGELWSAATSGWVAGGLGAPGPADALLTALVGPTLLTGGQVSATVSLLLLGSVLLAGWGAWAAAGAATRSTGVRAWAAVVWAGAPALLLALGDGRLGAVLAHVALPWVALGVARALGVQRVDRVLSGLATAEHDDDDEAPAPDAAPRTVPTQRVGADATYVGAPEPTGSVTAAAGAALAFAVTVAGAPVLLVPGVIATLLVVGCARRNRTRLLVGLLPALVLMGPTLVEAARRGVAGWRLLIAGPGLPLAGAPTTSVERLLGLPDDASALVPSWAEPIAGLWPLAVGAVVVLLAVLALLRGAPAARAIRVAWLVTGLALAAATVVVRIPVGTQDGVTVHGWAGPLLSLAGLGLLVAAVLGADQLRERLAHHTFGWRQPLVALLTAVAVVAPLAWLGGWTWQARSGDAVALHAIDGAVVPAVGQQSQHAPDSARVLALAAAPTAASDAPATSRPDATWQLMRGDGPLLVDQAAAVSTLVLTGDLWAPGLRAPDPAMSEVDDLVARLVRGSTTDVSAPLGALAVGDVLVPPLATDAGAGGRAARDRLVATLDSTPGLERVTQGPTGTLWRTQPVEDAQQEAVVSWARLLPPGSQVSDATSAIPVASTHLAVDTTIPAGDDGRQLVLAERADSHWHARLDGHTLRSVDDGWRQSFQVGADGGHLTVGYDAPQRTPWLAVQGLVFLLALLLAVPTRRRRGGRA